MQQCSTLYAIFSPSGVTPLRPRQRRKSEYAAAGAARSCDFSLPEIVSTMHAL